MNDALISAVSDSSLISFPTLGLELCPPSSFSLFGIEVHLYGVIIAAGFMLALLYCSHLCSEFGIKSGDLEDFFIFLLPSCIVGARLYYVVFNPGSYLDNPMSIFAVWEGGLAIYGGIIAGAVVAVLVCRHKKIPVTALLDLVIYGLLIGQIMGRWGNFFNREAFGAETEIFCRMGLSTADGMVYVHPTFLYESLWNLTLLIFLIVFLKKGKRRYDGQITLIYFFWYGLGRTWIEGLRTDSLYIGSTGIRVSQALSIGLCIVSLIILVIQSRRNHPAEKLYVNKARKGDSPEQVIES